MNIFSITDAQLFLFKYYANRSTLCSWCLILLLFERCLIDWRISFSLRSILWWKGLMPRLLISPEVWVRNIKNYLIFSIFVQELRNFCHPRSYHALIPQTQLDHYIKVHFLQLFSSHTQIIYWDQNLIILKSKNFDELNNFYLLFYLEMCSPLLRNS